MAMREVGRLSVPVRRVGATADIILPVIRCSKWRGEWGPVGGCNLDQNSVTRNAGTIIMAAPINLADKEVDDFITRNESLHINSIFWASDYENSQKTENFPFRRTRVRLQGPHFLKRFALASEGILAIAINLRAANELMTTDEVSETRLPSFLGNRSSLNICVMRTELSPSLVAIGDFAAAASACLFLTREGRGTRNPVVFMLTSEWEKSRRWNSWPAAGKSW